MSDRAAKLRTLYWALLLPVLLVLAQQGELRHEYSHYAKPVSEQKKAPAEPEHCPLCLAYAHLGGAARAEAPPSALAADLSFHFARPPEVAPIHVAGLAPRSRGPPGL
jgi:hypothetical protein